MALTERSRSALYLGLRNVVDEEALQEMLSFFPARDVEEPVSKEFLRAEIADLRTELKGDMADLENRILDRMDQRFKMLFTLTIGANVATVLTVAMVIFAAIKL
ncbi:MAG: hypothetical protein JST64_01275 [Actinobacteria bacterium]|nr:hypothetical protein [Actinomycetota bacterium]